MVSYTTVADTIAALTMAAFFVSKFLSIYDRAKDIGDDNENYQNSDSD